MFFKLAELKNFDAAVWSSINGTMTLLNGNENAELNRKRIQILILKIIKKLHGKKLGHCTGELLYLQQLWQ